MALKDEFKRDKETVKSLSWKDKIVYIWTYYKWHIIIPVAVVIALGNIIYHAVCDPEVILNGILLNAYGADSEKPVNEFIDEYAKEQGIDLNENRITFDISFQYVPDDASGAQNYEVIQALNAWIKEDVVDFICADTASMMELTQAQYLQDLRDVLSAEQLEMYEESLIYVEDVPLLLDISESEDLDGIYLDQHEEMAIAVPLGAPHIQETREFIDYLKK